MDWFKRSMAIVAASALVAVPTVAAQDASPPAATDIEIAYVLHGLNAFTERIQTGAQDAARAHQQATSIAHVCPREATLPAWPGSPQA